MTESVNPGLFPGLPPGLVRRRVTRFYSAGLVMTGASHTTTTIDGLASTAALKVGMSVTGASGSTVAAGLPTVAPFTTIAAIASSTSITLSAATTTTVAALSLTFGANFNSIPWTVPEGWRPEDELLLWLWSGAGAGGGSNSASVNGAFGAPGAFGFKRLTGLTEGQTISLIIGAGGVPGALGNVVGGPGGTSSFGTLLSITGGGGGGLGTGTTVATLPTPGAATGADFSFAGGQSVPGISSSTINQLTAGMGGYPFMSICGPGRQVWIAGTAGVSGSGFAGPGSGAHGSTPVAGGAGTAGCAFLQYDCTKDHDANIRAALSNLGNPMMF